MRTHSNAINSWDTCRSRRARGSLAVLYKTVNDFNVLRKYMLKFLETALSNFILSYVDMQQQAYRKKKLKQVQSLIVCCQKTRLSLE